MPLSINTSGLILASLCFVILALYGLRRARKVTEEDFLVGGRNVGSWQLAGTVSAGVMGGGVILVYAEYIFNYGISALWIVGGLVVGVLCLVFIVQRLKVISDKQHFVSLPDFYSYTWGRMAGFWATIIVLLWTLGFILMQLVSAGQVLSALTGLSYPKAVAFSAITVASYLLVSGFYAVIITDTIQYAALVFLLLILTILPIHSGNFAQMPASPPLDISEGLGFFILGALNIIVSADLWQRVYAAKSEKDAKRGFILSAVFISIAGALMFFPVMYVKMTTPTAPPNAALTMSLAAILPKWALGLGLAALLAAVISALDTMTFIFAVGIAHDITVRQLNRAVDHRVRDTRFWMFAILLFGSIISIWWQSLLTIGLALSSLGLVLVPSFLLFLTRRWTPRPQAVVWGLVAGILTTFVLILTRSLTPESALAAFGVSVLFTLCGLIYFKPIPVK